MLGEQIDGCVDLPPRRTGNVLGDRQAQLFKQGAYGADQAEGGLLRSVTGFRVVSGFGGMSRRDKGIMVVGT